MIFSTIFGKGVFSNHFKRMDMIISRLINGKERHVLDMYKTLRSRRFDNLTVPQLKLSVKMDELVEMCIRISNGAEGVDVQEVLANVEILNLCEGYIFDEDLETYLHPLLDTMPKCKTVLVRSCNIHYLSLSALQSFLKRLDFLDVTFTPLALDRGDIMEALSDEELGKLVYICDEKALSRRMWTVIIKKTQETLVRETHLRYFALVPPCLPRYPCMFLMPLDNCIVRDAKICGEGLYRKVGGEDMPAVSQRT